MNIVNELSKIKELPTLPEVLLNVKALISSDEADAATLAHFIGQDMALSSMVLKSANSVFHNPKGRRISSIREAITRIGFNEVLRLTLAVTLIKQFGNTKMSIGYKSFWTHSLTVAGLTGEIVSHLKISEEDPFRQEIYMAGLLHDIGIIIYDQFFHENLSRILEYAIHNNCTFIEAEKILAPRESHSFVGGALLELWKLSPFIIAGVRFHHTPLKAAQKYHQAVAVIACAEYLTCGNSESSFEGEFDEEEISFTDSLGLTVREIELLREKVVLETSKADILLSIGNDTQTTYMKERKKNDVSDDSLLRYI